MRHSTRHRPRPEVQQVGEVGYLLDRAGGAKIEAAFLRSIVQETLTIVDLELADYERIAELADLRRLPTWDHRRGCRCRRRAVRG